MKYLEGTLRISTKGVGFVSLPDNASKEAVEIGPAFLNTALNGDLVKVSLHSRQPDERLTGEVESVLRRKRLEFVGVLEKENGFYFLVPDDKRLYKDILIAERKLSGAREGDKVLVTITEWRDPKKDPLGEVLTIIGKPGEHETEMQSIVYEKGFRPAFAPEVETEAKAIKSKAAEDLARETRPASGGAGRRRDFRGVPTFTIDPSDAKDFDDAISCQKDEAGRLEIGIHIADVAHFVKPNTALDEEAIKRGTSIYLVDRTIPMLPEILSNDLCSLNPDEDKLTFSAVFTFDEKFNLASEWFGRTIIRSQKRFAYEEAQKSIGAAGPYHQELALLNQLAEKLRQDKMAAGAIAFEQPEIKFVLDKNFRPIKIYKKIRLPSNLLIEDLMLLANRKVAEFVSRIVQNAEKKFVYRVHDKPDPEKIKQLAELAAPLGHRLQTAGERVAPQSINQLLRAVAGRPEENLIQTAAMRSMAKAVYSTKNIGHFGLAFAHYAHFTSPIRRYPDIMVHRLLDFYLRGDQPAEEMLQRYDRLAIYCSERELQAQEAERDSIKYKQVEFMLDKTGRVFRGVISHIAKWGIYVQENETLAEGLIRLSELKDDYYILDEKNFALVGEKTGRRFQLGDRVKMRLLRADLKERTLDFAFV